MPTNLTSFFYRRIKIDNLYPKLQKQEFMRPFKRGKLLAGWLLRLALVGFIIMIHYHTVRTFNYKVQGFYFSLIYMIFAVLIIIGGLLNSNGLTVISGLFIFVLSVYFLIVSFKGSFDNYIMDRFIIATLGFYFFTAGNKN